MLSVLLQLHRCDNFHTVIRDLKIPVFEHRIICVCLSYLHEMTVGIFIPNRLPHSTLGARQRASNGSKGVYVSIFVFSFVSDQSQHSPGIQVWYPTVPFLFPIYQTQTLFISCCKIGHFNQGPYIKSGQCWRWGPIHSYECCSLA